MSTPLPRSPRWLAALVALAVTLGARAGWESAGRVNATPPLLNEKFGISVAVDGDWMAVGASESTVGASRSTGSVHMFRNQGGTWTYRQTLFSPRPLIFQIFGCAVALRGNTLAVGSWGANSFSGRAHVFTRSAADVWEFTTTLQASDPQESRPALFGWSISLDIPTGAPPVIAVGRPNDGDASAGAVYVFEFVGGVWTEVVKLTAPNASVSEQIGSNVSVCAGTIVCGSARYRRATVFRRTDGVWAFEATLTSDASVTGDGFGSAVASGGSFVAVGSPNRAYLGRSKAGAVTVFSRLNDGSWSEGVELTLPVPRFGDNFGYALAATPFSPAGLPLIVVGVPGFDNTTTDSGIGVVFELSADQWRQTDTDLWSSAAVRGQFAGKAVAVSVNGRAAALSSDLPRGSAGGAFPMVWSSGPEGSSVTGNGGGGGGGDTGGGGTGGGGTGGGDTGGGGTGGGGDSGGASDPLDGGSTDDPGSNIGSGGRPRAPNQLPPLPAPFGAVTDTVIIDADMQQTVVGVQTNGVQEGAGPSVQVLATYPATWSLATMGDVNGDGSGDLIWRNDTGKIVTWLRDGTRYLAKHELRALNASESIVASLDFDGDGIQDVITRDADDHELHVLRMRAGTIETEITIPLPGAGWTVVPHPMVSGMLIRHPASGEVRRLDQNLFTGAVTVAAAPSPEPEARIEGIGDVDGDGADDMVTRNPGTDELVIWRLDRRGNLIEARDLGIDGGRWKVEAVRDWDHNGCDDLLVSEGGSGRLVVLSMVFEDGVPQILQSRVIGSVGGARVLDVTPR